MILATLHTWDHHQASKQASNMSMYFEKIWSYRVVHLASSACSQAVALDARIPLSMSPKSYCRRLAVRSNNSISSSWGVVWSSLQAIGFWSIVSSKSSSSSPHANLQCSSFARWQLLSSSKSSPGSSCSCCCRDDDADNEDKGGCVVPSKHPAAAAGVMVLLLFLVGEVINLGVVHIEFFWLSMGVICVAMFLWPNDGCGLCKVGGVGGSVPISLIDTEHNPCFGICTLIELLLQNSSVPPNPHIVVRKLSHGRRRNVIYRTIIIISCFFFAQSRLLRYQNIQWILL